MSTLPPDLEARILHAARTTPSATRASSRRHFWLVLSLSLLAAGSVFLAFHGPDRGHLASSLGVAGVAALSVWGALGQGPAATGRPLSVLWSVAIGTPAALFAMKLAFATLDPSLAAVHPERLGLRCLGLTLALAVLPLLALLSVRRGSDAVHPARTGAAFGAACGASAGALVEMWCPVSNMHHVALGHILPIVALTLVGAALGARLLAIRAQQP